MAGVLVLGGGPAGLESALYLADRDQEVILVERNEHLGGSPRLYNCKTVDECRRCGACLAAERVYQVHRHPLVQVITESGLSAVRAAGDRFQVEIDGVSGHLEVEAAGIILATGFELFDPALRSEMGYSRCEGVVTARELEASLKGLRDWEQELGPLPRIAIVRCFGSREQSRGVSYCSRICCLYSEKLAQILIDRAPGATVDVFCMDNQNYHPVYGAGEPGAVRYIRGMPARVDRLNNGRLILKYEDAANSRVEQGHYDWLVLCPAILPVRDNRGIYEMLGVDRDDRGFIAATPKGVFAAGCCTGPKTIVESLGSGRAAAGRLLTHLSSAKVYPGHLSNG